MSLDILFLFFTASAVTIGSLVPARVLPRLPNDKAMHFFAYTLLAVLIARVVPPGSTLESMALLVLGGWLIEVLQNLVPGRKFCWYDLAANICGIACGTILGTHVVGQYT